MDRKVETKPDWKTATRSETVVSQQTERPVENGQNGQLEEDRTVSLV